jgi:hypothetical protein
MQNTSTNVDVQNFQNQGTENNGNQRRISNTYGIKKMSHIVLCSMTFL